MERLTAFCSSRNRTDVSALFTTTRLPLPPQGSTRAPQPGLEPGPPSPLSPRKRSAIVDAHSGKSYQDAHFRACRANPAQDCNLLLPETPSTRPMLPPDFTPGDAWTAPRLGRSRLSKPRLVKTVTGVGLNHLPAARRQRPLSRDQSASVSETVRLVEAGFHDHRRYPV